MVLIPTTAMKVGDAKDSFEAGIDMKDKASDMERLNTESDIQVVKHGHVNKFSWMEKCQHTKKGDIRPMLKFFGNVQEGIHTDIKQGRKKGETSPPEFWARVWDEIHSSGGGPTDNLPTKALKAKWNEMQTNGRSSDEIWEHMEKEYPGPFLLVPLIKRWHQLGQGESVDNVRMFDGLEEFNYMVLMIDQDDQDTTQLRQKLENLTDEKEKNEFWEKHWDDIHGMKRMKAICDNKTSRRRHRSRSDVDDWEKWMFPQRQTDVSGNEIKTVPGYQKYYPLGYSLYKRLRKPADERPIYKEFDFCS